MRLYRSWLPDAALEGCAVERSLADVAHQWSAKWFARQNMRLLGAMSCIEPLPACPAEQGWMVLDDDLAVGVPGMSHVAIASLMLDRPIETSTLSVADHQMVHDLATACLDDLCGRLAQIFRLPPDSRWRMSDSASPPLIDRPRGCGIGLEGKPPLLHLVVSTDLLVASIKSALAIPVPGNALGPIASALATQPLGVTAALGRCQLTLADLAGLSEGDVLIFDRATSASLPLAIDGGASGGLCSVERHGEHLQLKIITPPIR